MTFEGSNAGSKVGLEIWRIEKLQPVRIDSASFGKFYSGDCYLILNTYEKGRRKYMDLHYWLGNESSQDEQGSCAYRAVELDDFLGGSPIQHREVEGYESALMLSYFPAGIQYLEGGVDSAFNHVDRDAFNTRLFHVKGRRNVRCVQVELKASSLNDGDVFLLDAGMTIYQWNGASSNRYERTRGLEMATKIRDSERGAKARLVFLDSNQDDADSAAFFALLGGSKADVKKAEDGGNDDDAASADPVSLWRISDATGTLTIDQVAKGKLERNMLDVSDVFLVDAPGHVFVWIGKGATSAERSKGMSFASEYLKQHSRPSWTSVTRVVQCAETPQFKSLFAHWEDETSNKIGQEEEYVAKERKIELDGLLARRKEVQEQVLNVTTINLQIWRIDNLSKVLISPNEYGLFYSGDSYIILHQYRYLNRDAYTLFFWQGRDSTTDEKAASALLAVDMASELNTLSNGSQVRVTQNREPLQFLNLFKGKMIVRFGGVKGSGAFARNDDDSDANSDKQLFHIRGTSSVDTRAVQVAPLASSLNSGDVYVALDPSTLFVWYGRGSNADERTTALSLSQSILKQDRTLVELQEGEESETFWQLLGGKLDYANTRTLQSAPVDPRLFQVSGVTGNFKVEELFNWSQDDLLQDGVFIIDVFDEVYVWLGRNARTADKDAALRMACEYVLRAPDARPSDTPVYRVEAGSEPPQFTAHFRGWSFEKSSDFEDPYTKKLNALKQAGATAAAPATASSSAPAPTSSPSLTRVDVAAVTATASSSSSSSSSSAVTQFFPLSELKSGVPTGVVASKKELYLSDDEFKQTFGVDKEAFAKLPIWKQQDAKKKAGIF